MNLKKGTALDLRGFFIYLGAEKFPAGWQEWQRAQSLLEAGSRATADWKFVLAPIFARDRHEQKRFYDAFDEYFIGEKPPAPETVQPGRKPVGKPETPAAPKPRSWRPFIWFAVFVALLGAAIWLYTIRPELVIEQRQVPPPRQSSGPAGQPQQTSPQVTVDTTVRVERPCAGWECVTATPRGWLIVLPLTLWLLYEFGLAQKSIRLQAQWRDRRRKGPFVWPMFGGHAAPSQDPAFDKAARALQLRRTGYHRRLNLEKSISATIRAAGCPMVLFEREERTPEYIVLVERLGRRDHLAAWIGDIADELRRNDMRVRMFSFEADLRSCRTFPENRRVSLARLAAAYPDGRLIVIGPAAALLDSVSGDPAAWTNVISNAWPERVLLTPYPADEYGAAERRLLALMPVLPFSVSALTTLPTLFEAPLTLRDSRIEVSGPDGMYPTPPDALLNDAEEDAETVLPAFFSPPVFQWLCACAIHTEIEWPLTLALGEVVLKPDSRVMERTLLPLVRLPWFRTGRMPDTWRAKLNNCLAPHLLPNVRSEIIGMLNRNRAPRGTFARDKQTIDIEAQAYWRVPTAGSRARLERSLAAADESILKGDVLLAELHREWTHGSSREPGLAWARYLTRRGPWMTALTGAATAVVAASLAGGSVTETTIVKSTLPATTTTPPPVTETPPAPKRPPEDSSSPTPATQKPTVPPKSEGRRPSVEQKTADPKQAMPPQTIPLATEPPPSETTIELAAGFTAGITGTAIPGQAVAQLAPPPARTRLQYPVTNRDGATLTIAFRTSAGYPLPTEIDITLSRDGRVIKREPDIRFDSDPTGTVALTGLEDGTYALHVDPSGEAGQTTTIVVRNKLVDEVVLRSSKRIDSKDVIGMIFPLYEQLPAQLRTALERTNIAGQSGKVLFEGLSTADRARLLNCYAKAANTPVGNRTVANFISDFQSIGQEIIAVVDLNLRDAVIAVRAAGRFVAVPASLHKTPAGFQPAGSYRSIDSTLALQLTFFVSGSRWLVDMDLDRAGGYANRIRDAIGPRDPSEINQVLLAQAIDPGYRLVTHPDLLPGSKRPTAR